MRTFVVVLINEPWPRLREIYLEAGLEKAAAEGPSRTGLQEVVLDEKDPTLARLRAALKKARITPWERREHSYTDEELTQAPLLAMTVRTAPKGEGGLASGTAYDFTLACRECGAGAVQVSPLVLRASDGPKSRAIFQTHAGEVLVSAVLADALWGAGLCGVECRQAVTRKGEKLPWFQLVPLAELPPMSRASTGLVRENQCTCCRRDGHYHAAHEPLVIVYDSLPDARWDFSSTWERFGAAGRPDPPYEGRIAQPLILVSSRAYQIFRKTKVPGVAFSPVRIKK